MVEDAVEDDADAARLRRRHQCLEVGLRAQVGVDDRVVARVVAVVGGRREDRVEVEDGDPEVGERVELRGDAGEVAAEEVPAQRALVAGDALVGAAVAFRPLVPSLDQDRVAVDVAVAVARRSLGPRLRVGGRVVGRVAVEEAVGEDLVGDRPARPGGSGEVPVVEIDLPRGVGALAVDPARAAVEGRVVLHVPRGGTVLHDEAVVEDRRRLRRVERRLPVVEAVLAGGPVAGGDGHGDEDLDVGQGVVGAHRGRGQVPGRRPETQRHGGAGRDGAERRPVEVVAAVVGEVRLADLAVGREGREIRHADRARRPGRAGRRRWARRRAARAAGRRRHHAGHHDRDHHDGGEGEQAATRRSARPSTVVPGTHGDALLVIASPAGRGRRGPRARR